MTPGPQQRLLHDVLRPRGIPGQAQRVAPQRSACSSYKTRIIAASRIVHSPTSVSDTTWVAVQFKPTPDAEA